MNSYLKARMEDKITRAEVAKIISIYAEKFMDKKALLNPMCDRFKDLGDINVELQGYAVKACNLGLMGYWSNGVHTKEYFSPNDTITRAEIGILLSRLFR
ncbi:MAG: S-layer homology domain-containing protein [Candidatus Peribacteria bacterium]|jgi:hypothetical protein|nr:S-layer homology domain-containing protein [Candidatus Peribacteria bacterium]